MKLLMQPIDMIAWFTRDGILNPIRYQMIAADDSSVVVKVNRILNRSEEKIAGNPILIFRCQSEINGFLKQYELKYELNTCKWYLYKL